MVSFEDGLKALKLATQIDKANEIHKNLDAIINSIQ